MSDPRDPVERLAALGSTGVPPLAAVEQVRARGEQRRRTRAVAGLTAAAVVLTGAGALALGGGDLRQDSLRPDSFASPTAAPSATPTVPTTSPSPAPRLDPLRVRAEQLVQASDVAALLGGDWAQPPDRSSPTLGLVVCPAGDAATEEGRVHEINRTGPRAGEDTVVSKVVRVSDGRRVVALIRADLDECPVRDDGNERDTYALVGPGGSSHLVVRHTRRDCRDCETSTGLGIVVAHEQYVGYLSLPESERPRLDAWVDLVSRRLRGSDPAPAPWDPARAMLTAAEASRAESPGLSSEPLTASEPLLDPCGDGTEFTKGAVRTAQSKLTSQREAGGSALVQRVARFRDEAAAGRAAAAYLDRVRRCPVVEDDPMGEPSETRYAVVARTGDPDSGVSTALVRRVPCREGSCTEHFAVYRLVVRSENGVAVAAYEIGEDGDPREDAESLLRAMAAKLAGVTG